MCCCRHPPDIGALQHCKLHCRTLAEEKTLRKWRRGALQCGCRSAALPLCRNALSSQARPVWNLKASPSPPAFPHSAEGGELTERTFHWVCLQYTAVEQEGAQIRHKQLGKLRESVAGEKRKQQCALLLQEQVMANGWCRLLLLLLLGITCVLARGGGRSSGGYSSSGSSYYSRSYLPKPNTKQNTI